MRSQGRFSLMTVIASLPLSASVIASSVTGSSCGETAAAICPAVTVHPALRPLSQQCCNAVASAADRCWTNTGRDPISADGFEPYDPDPNKLTSYQDGPVISFEEWKELMLLQHGQDHANSQEHHNPWVSQKADEDGEPSFDNVNGGGEISLGPDAPLDQAQGSAYAPTATCQSNTVQGDKSQYSPSKDAGKTCRERFSYSSFDAGATVLKASPGALNPKAILLENKDSYMLFKCAAVEKYVIVELSDDILIDTIVLANFEFFSSMVRHFRVTVSDRYPAKSERWRELGTFEGKNARDIQPFLIENPQIWAKYIRVDFLTHYGNEYYCPVSLLRVHGTRMLESWKESEGLPDDDYPQLESEDRGCAEAETRGTLPKYVDNEASKTSPRAGALVFGLFLETCPASIPRSEIYLFSDTAGHQTGRVTQQRRTSYDMDPAGAQPASAPSQSPSTSFAVLPTETVPDPTLSVNGYIGKADDGVGSPADFVRGSDSGAAETLGQGRTAEQTPGQQRSRTVASVSQSALPIVQESFFRSVSKRLQVLESNMTWTLKYVEDQSRHTQEALMRIEHERLSEAEALLGILNRTMHLELSVLRQQVDHVWQSTAIALDLQKEQSRSEMVALSSRLNILADEAVFQKRMSIAQSVLLLCCLVLTIFSRLVNPEPFVNWQPRTMIPSPDTAESARRTPRTRARRTSPVNARPAQSSLHPEYGVFPGCGPASSEVPPELRITSKRSVAVGYGEAESSLRSISDETAPEWSDTRHPSFYTGLGQGGTSHDAAEPAPMPGSGHARKPLPPLPE
jgi:hypothetical protein